MIKEINSHKEIKQGLLLIADVFQKFQAPEYSKKGIENFYKFIDTNHMIELIDNKKITLYGFYKNEKVVGVIGIRNPNHICLLFVSEKFHKQGIAKQLFQHWLNLNSESVTEVTVNSSPYAVSAYKHLGFIGKNSIIETDGIQFVPLTFSLV